MFKREKIQRRSARVASDRKSLEHKTGNSGMDIRVGYWKQRATIHKQQATIEKLKREIVSREKEGIEQEYERIKQLRESEFSNFNPLPFEKIAAQLQFQVQLLFYFVQAFVHYHYTTMSGN